VEAAAADSFDPAIRLNLGLAYLKNEETDKAAQEFILLISSRRRIQRCSHARYDLGIALTSKQDIPGALSAYQAALELNPQSKEVKQNIELLWSQQNGSKGGGKSDDKKKARRRQERRGQTRPRKKTTISRPAATKISRSLNLNKNRLKAKSSRPTPSEKF
jgi:tetratricopeptide (TPR) repeat protein